MQSRYQSLFPLLAYLSTTRADIVVANTTDVDGNDIVPVTDYACGEACEDFSQIVKGCLMYNFPASQEVYHACVCKNGNYNQSVTPCVQCQGGNSSALAMSSQAGIFFKNCPMIGNDCTVACNPYASVIASCSPDGVTDDQCICKYTTEADFEACTSCTGPHGRAASMQKKCEATGYNGTVTSPQPSATTTQGSDAGKVLEPIAAVVVGSVLFSLVL